MLVCLHRKAIAGSAHMMLGTVAGVETTMTGEKDVYKSERNGGKGESAKRLSVKKDQATLVATEQ